VSAPQAGLGRIVGWRRTAVLLIVSLLTLAVLVLLPVAVQSLVSELRRASGLVVYDMITGQPVTDDATGRDGPDGTFLDVIVSGIDESTRTATLQISGHRICSAQCPPVKLTFFSLRQEESARHGMPYVATVEAPTASEPMATSVTLPVDGRPPLYPFDSYRLALGMGAEVTRPDGGTISPPPEMVRKLADVTVQDGVARMTMAQPQPLDAVLLIPGNAPIKPVAALDLTFRRPVYLQVITVLLVLLIAASGFFALATQSLGQLSLGIGGLILGIWGIRSVVIQGNLPDITVVDSVLAIIILLMLLGVAIRVALAVRAAPAEGARE